MLSTDERCASRGNGGAWAPKDLGIGPTAGEIPSPADSRLRPSPFSTTANSPRLDGTYRPSSSTRERRLTVQSVSQASVIVANKPGASVLSRKRHRLRDWVRGFHRHFITDGNWSYLLGVCSCWFLLDVSFYGLGLSSPSIIQELWYGSDGAKGKTVYFLLWGNSWHPSIIVSLAAMLGGLCMIIAVRYGIRLIVLQASFFVVLGVLLEVVGGTFGIFVRAHNGSHWGLVVLYFFCQFFFNFGPNSTTYMVSAPDCGPVDRIQKVCELTSSYRYPQSTSRRHTAAQHTASLRPVDGSEVFSPSWLLVSQVRRPRILRRRYASHSGFLGPLCSPVPF